MSQRSVDGRRGMKGHADAVAVAAVVMLVLVMPAPTLADERGADARDPASLVADQLLVLMHASLEGPSEPRPDQLERARVLLEQALTLHGNDAELWRLRAELAGHMNDTAARRDALMRYVRLRPADDAAQLALIHAHLAGVQTLDGRLQRAESILRSTQGRAFSAPLRSRLAMSAAEAAHELGRMDVFTHWLREAVALDPANPDAAVQAYQLTLERSRDMARIGAAAVHHAAAAPANADARVELADVLLSQALYRQAAEQYAVAQRLAVRPLTADVYADRALALAALGEDAAALALLELLQPQRQANDADDAGATNATGMGIELELLRLAILHTTSDPHRQAAQRSYDRLARQLRQRVEQNHADTARGARAKADLAWTQLLLDRDIESAAALVEELIQASERDDAHDAALFRARLPRLRAWLALREGDEETAYEAFRDQLEDDAFAPLGLAQLTSDPDRRGRLLISALHRSPDSLAGLLAVRQLRARGESIPMTSTGRSLETVMARYPSQLWQPALTVSPWVQMELRMGPAGSIRLGYLQPVTLTLHLRNASRFPLPIADGRGVPTRVLLTMTPTVNASRVAQPAPIVVDVDRRLTLAPGESLAVDVRLDRGQLGAMLAQLPHRHVRFDVTAILGPQPTRDGRFAPEPVGQSSTLHGLEITGTSTDLGDRGVQADGATLEQMIEALNAGDTLAQMHAVAWLMRLFEDGPALLDDAATRQRISDAINDAAARFDILEQAWVARFLPRDAQVREAFDGAVERVEASDEPVVRIVYLASHASEADDPLLAASLDHQNIAIRHFAIALHEGLQAMAGEDE